MNSEASAAEAGPSTGGVFSCVGRHLHAIFLQKPLLSLLHMFLPPALIFARTAGEDAGREALTFAFSLLALVPLAERLGYVTEQLALHVGEVTAGLLNVCAGNAPELVVTIVALVRGENHVAQDALVGAIVSNVLLVGGLSFVAGGIRHRTQRFNTTLSSTLLSSLFLMALIISLVSFMPERSTSVDPDGVTRTVNQSAQISHVIAICALAVYLAFLLFSLRTHAYLFNGEPHTGAELSFVPDGDDEQIKGGDGGGGDGGGGNGVEDGDGGGGGRGGWGGCGSSDSGGGGGSGGDDDILGLWGSCFWLVVLVVFVTWVSDGLVDSINGAAAASGWSELFITAIILPNVNNAPEHAVSIRLGYKNKVDAVVSICVGSATQLALFLLPCAVLFDWAYGGMMDFHLPGIEATGLMCSVLFATLVLQSGVVTWMHGLSLVVAYLCVGAAWFYQPTFDMTSLGELGAAASASPSPPLPAHASLVLLHAASRDTPGSLLPARLGGGF
jgi:Ca2+:H+ antiporter